MWTNASLPRPSATWMQIVSIRLGLFGADAGLVTKAMERIASVSSLWNFSFSRWRYLTTVTTSIHFVFSFLFKFVNPPKVKKRRSNNPKLYKETKNNKLKDSGGWRKMTSSCGLLNVFVTQVGSFVAFYPWCDSYIMVWYFPFAADGTCDGVICDQNSACVPIALGSRDRQCVCLDGWTGDGRSCTGKK